MINGWYIESCITRTGYSSTISEKMLITLVWKNLETKESSIDVFRSNNYKMIQDLMLEQKLFYTGKNAKEEWQRRKVASG